MNNRIVVCEIIEAEVEVEEAILILTVQVETESPTTSIRAWLSGPTADARPIVRHDFQPVQLEEEDAEPGLLAQEVVLPDPAVWSPKTPCLYQGEVTLWQDGLCVDKAPLRYSYYALEWQEDELELNDKPFVVSMIEVDHLDEATARKLCDDGINVVMLPASQSDAWELADRVGLLLLGMLPPDGSLPADLHDRTTRPSCLGWVLPSIETPLPADELPGFFGVRSALPFEELPDEIDFLLLDADPDLDEGDALGYPWLVRQK